VDERACAHRARLFRHVQVAVGQSPIANGCFGLRQRKHLGVCGGVLEQFNLIVSARYDLALANDNSANRNFVAAGCFFGKAHRFAHEILVGWRLNHIHP